MIAALNAGTSVAVRKAVGSTENEVGAGLNDKHRLPMGFNLELNEIRCARARAGKCRQVPLDSDVRRTALDQPIVHWTLCLRGLGAGLVKLVDQRRHAATVDNCTDSCHPFT